MSRPLRYLIGRSLRNPGRGLGRGEPLTSLLAGVCSLSIGLVDLVAILGLAPTGHPELARRVIYLGQNAARMGGNSTSEGPWLVPGEFYWKFVFAGTACAVSGLVLSRNQGRRTTSMAGLSLHGLLLLGGIALFLTDHMVW